MPTPSERRAFAVFQFIPCPKKPPTAKPRNSPSRKTRRDLIAGVDLTDEPQEVTNILIDLAQRETLNQSARFARHLVQELRQVTKLLRNSHRFAGFAVLKAPDVPSVLIEMGFLSNARDEQALRKPAYRARLARSVERAVDRYFNQIQQAER